MGHTSADIDPPSEFLKLEGIGFKVNAPPDQ